ncbi:MAG: PQQ-binding-like beta-propeller repeat protein, partial [Verrucomicrobiia bacterium]
MKTPTLLIALTLLLSQPAFAGDWTQYRGPQRNDLSSETGLLKKWPDAGPRLLWTFKNSGIGLTGPAVVGERLYITGGRAGTEYLIALNLRTGTEAWAVA